MSQDWTEFTIVTKEGHVLEVCRTAVEAEQRRQFWEALGYAGAEVKVYFR